MNVGVLGGGQLGRMLAIAGQSLDTRFRLYDPNPQAPAREFGELIVAPYEDSRALERFAQGLDVVTYEFESIPLPALETVGRKAPVYPSLDALKVAQDRVLEKQCFQRMGILTASSRAVTTRDDLDNAVREIGLPGVLKTRRFGYDGKGQAVIRNETELDRAWEQLGGVPLILEQYVAFDRELSIIACRARTGETVFYPLIENTHEGGILSCSVAPAEVRESITQVARDYIGRLMSSFDYVGVLTLEMFQSGDKLIANEIAPRVHNSGHWTIEGAQTSQFENHVRAVCGRDLGSADALSHSIMLNILGAVPDLAQLRLLAGTYVHMYGKSPAPRRKLGHVTVVGETPHEVQQRAELVRRVLGEARAST